MAKKQKQEPLVVTTEEAASMIGRTPSTLRGWRVLSAKRMKDGGAPMGPAWLVINGHSVVYELAALKAWLAANAVPFGQAAFRGHIHRDGDAR
jgi:hypothetical protein